MGFLIVELAWMCVVKTERARINDQIVVVALHCVVDRRRILASGDRGGYAALAAPGERGSVTIRRCSATGVILWWSLCVFESEASEVLRKIHEVRRTIIEAVNGVRERGNK